MAQRNSKAKANNLWYLVGFFTILSVLLLSFIPIIAIIIVIAYIIASGSPKKYWSLAFIIGIIGPIVVYFACKDSDSHLSSLSKKLLIGQIMGLAIVLVLVVLPFVNNYIINSQPVNQTILNQCFAYNPAYATICSKSPYKQIMNPTQIP
jgi:hypothetical protein